MADFNTSVQYTLLNEGSTYTNNPADSGGPTKYGITLTDLGRWYAMHGRSVPNALDVKGLSQAEAIQIYQAFYWVPTGVEPITNQVVATAIFDMGVNLGIGKSVQIAQVAAGVKVDGKFGPMSIAAINVLVPEQFLAKFIIQVQVHYIEVVLANPARLVFLKGWLTRSQKLITLMVS